MLFILMSVVVMSGSGRAGYIYQRPNIAFDLPINALNFQGSSSETRQENLQVHHTHESELSYPILTYNDNNRNQQNFNLPEPSDVPGEIPNIPLPISQGNNVEVNTVQHVNVLQENIDSNFPTALNVQNIVPPKIKKHIYFHVPPPEIEDTPTLLAIPPKKKIYKIIFIKVPSQETRNIVQLQRTAFNQAALVEDKTIIYVLSKKPETPAVILPKPIPSEHEVLFVKYRGNPEEAIDEIADGLVPSEPSVLPTPILQPGLINGKR